MNRLYYRYYDRNYSDGGIISVTEYSVIRETEKSVWLNVYGEEKILRKNARRSFAYPTKELALNSYRRRKECQVKRLTEQLRHAKECEQIVSAPDFEASKTVHLSSTWRRALSPWVTPQT